jgi:GTP-binding protein EngB required for normal cell division
MTSGERNFAIWFNERGENEIMHKKQIFDQIYFRLKELRIAKNHQDAETPQDKWALLEPLLDVDVSKFRAIAIGQQNAGKSTLLNVLCERFDDEWFKTADVIETVEIKEAEHEGVVYVDTPGLGTTRVEDDLKSHVISRSASVIFFVHSCFGELMKEELDTLKQLVTEYDDPEERIVVLCSKKRDKAHEEEVNSIVEKIRGQIAHITDKRIEIIAIDSLDYRDGKREREPALVDVSNIPKLMHWLKKRQDMKNPTERQFDAVKAEVVSMVVEHRNALQAKSEKWQKQGVETMGVLLGRWQGLLSKTLEPAQRQCRERAEKLDDLRQELNRI